MATLEVCAIEIFIKRWVVFLFELWTRLLHHHGLLSASH